MAEQIPKCDSHPGGWPVPAGSEAIESALRVLMRQAPCPHDNLDTRLGNGTVWAKCQDCGATIEQASIKRSRKVAREFEDAIFAVRTLASSSPAAPAQSAGVPAVHSTAEAHGLLHKLRAHIVWLAFGECRSPGWEGPPPTAREAVDAIDAALSNVQPKGTQEPYGFESGLVQLLNEARCLSKETVGNRELAGRVMKYIRMHWNADDQAPAPSQPQGTAEEWLRSRYGAYRGHFAWRELEDAFNAGATTQAPAPAHQREAQRGEI